MQNLNIGLAPGNEARGSGQEVRALKNGQIHDGSGRGTKHWRFQDCCSMKGSMKHNESLTSVWGFFLKACSENVPEYTSTFLHFANNCRANSGQLCFREMRSPNRAANIKISPVPSLQV